MNNSFKYLVGGSLAVGALALIISAPKTAGNLKPLENDRMQESKEFGIVMNRWKKEKSFALKSSGYHTYFGLCSTSLSNDDEFDVDEDATKAQIKRAFVKSLKNKKMNKKVLGEFVELVA